MAGEYEVGFGRPPKRTRWKKGQSGNPGRRRSRRFATTAEIIEKLLLAPIEIIENGDARRTTVMEAITRQLWKKAVDGHPRAVDVLLKYQELAEQHPQIATEITFGDNPHNQNCGCTPPPEMDDDDGRV
jgi:Family of unknown function (DUF5681)